MEVLPDRDLCVVHGCFGMDMPDAADQSPYLHYHIWNAKLDANIHRDSPSPSRCIVDVSALNWS
jgi:G:T-mismatch repair DNA endonuclease (very short patch repair protein)